MKATNIGKTIIVWERLSDEEATRLVKAITHIVLDYQEKTSGDGCKKPIPIALLNKGSHLAIIKKQNEIIVSTNKFNGKWSFMPILNGDELYPSVALLERYSCKKYLTIYERYPNTIWIKLPFNKAFEEYSLSPNINPQNFIRHLETGTLSETYKQFLRDVGLALEDRHYSAELQSTIEEANNLFLENEER